ncbi:hypothetical protein SUNI508_00560 [Seiridium unicorne]|uniref:Uncharacterized protein n=1 Tax=Seiridium unicorne TaxID=138068 RepID=A0ABR2V724_9PEZI
MSILPLTTALKRRKPPTNIPDLTDRTHPTTATTSRSRTWATINKVPTLKGVTNSRTSRNKEATIRNPVHIPNANTRSRAQALAACKEFLLVWHVAAVWTVSSKRHVSGERKNRKRGLERDPAAVGRHATRTFRAMKAAASSRCVDELSLLHTFHPHIGRLCYQRTVL